MGGYSEEAHVSFNSGKVVMANLDKAKYKTFAIHIYEDRKHTCISN